MALKAVRPNSQVKDGTKTGGSLTNENSGSSAPSPANSTNTNVPVNVANTAVANRNASEAISNYNQGVLDNIDGLGNGGNFVTMDGTEFLYKATDERVKEVDAVICYGKRYYQWVEEDGDAKVFHDSDTRLDDRYKLKFEIHWQEEKEEGEVVEYQFHMPTASAMRFIDYVKALAGIGFGVNQVVTRISISRQVQKGTSNRYSRAEFTMMGTVDADGTVTEVPHGVSTVGK